MSQEQRDVEDRLAREEEEREMARKAKEMRTLLGPIDKRISRLAPRTRRRLGSNLTKLHKAHTTRKKRISQERGVKKLMTKQKAKATRAFNKQTKEHSLDAENKEVVRAFMANGYPVEIAVKVARDRQDLQELDRSRRRRLRELQAEVVELEGELEEADANIASVRIDVNAMLRRQRGEMGDEERREWDSGEDEDPDWLDWYLEDTQLSLASMEAARASLDRDLSDKANIIKELQSLLKL